MRWSGGSFALVLLLIAAGGRADDERSAVFGRWATSGTIVEIAPNGEGLSARLIALKHPLYREKDRTGQVGTPRLDHENPDPVLKDRPLLGIELLSEYEFTNGIWQGRFYLPENGRTLATRLSVQDDGRLRIRGFLFGLSWLGRSELLVPVSECNEDILRMVAEAGLDDCAGVSRP